MAKRLTLWEERRVDNLLRRAAEHLLINRRPGKGKQRGGQNDKLARAAGAWRTAAVGACRKATCGDSQTHQTARFGLPWWCDQQFKKQTRSILFFVASMHLSEALGKQMHFVSLSLSLCLSVCVCLCVFMCGASAMKVNAWMCAPLTASDLESASRKSART